MKRNVKLIENPEITYKKREINNVKIVSPPDNNDYYHRSALYFRVEDNTLSYSGEAFLMVSYMDNGLGLIQVEYDAQRIRDDSVAEDNPVYTKALDGIGYTCLDTGKIRQAIFRLENPAFQHRQKYGADIRIFGVEALIEVEIKETIDEKEWNSVLNGVPADLESRVKLTRPIQLVISVGSDCRIPSQIDRAIRNMRELCPLAKVLGFNGFEGYVKWNFVEHNEGCFDWDYYDAILSEARKYGLKWFPLLIAGSGYALPEWYYERAENTGFKCLEHEKSTDIPTIFSGDQDPFVRNFLKEFGSHYEDGDSLLGVRLGPSGNYGESQYPATGDWGYKWQKHHIHIGWWAGDPFALVSFQRFLKCKYNDIHTLNNAWGEDYTSYDDIKMFLPPLVENKRKRKDFTDWYIGSMTEWCEKWAMWAREAMPSVDIYQSSGGWGFSESGTDFTEQTKSMVGIKGGIRSTNEDDCYTKNFCMTRMMSSAARFYGIPYGSEPAGFSTVRGVTARLYNTIVNNGEHLFYYHPNLLENDQAIHKWLELAPLLDERDDPFIEVAALYPTTKSRLDDTVLRYINASSFNQYVVELRSHLDFDFCSEMMIRDGALTRYKVLLFLSRYQNQDVVEADVLDGIDAWVEQGGVVIYPYKNRSPLGTVEDDYTIYNKWLRGETGKGSVIFYRGDWDPPYRYPEFIKEKLLEIQNLHTFTKRMLRIEKSKEIYASILKNGKFVLLNYSDITEKVHIPGCAESVIEPYSIKIIK